MKGYKVFNSDWTCRGKQYSCPGEFTEDVTPEVCERGIHFCKKLSDCFNYYSFNSNNKVAEVETFGKVVENGDKCCTDKLRIVRELTWHEVLDLCNTGNWNTGNRNTGDCNTGNCNTGKGNTGDYNTGRWNTGDWNAGMFSNGFFNTVDHPFYMFDKQTDEMRSAILDCKGMQVLRSAPHTQTDWVDFSDMSDEEKEQNDGSEINGGYLKTVEVTADDRQKWWDSLSKEDKEAVKSLPNFDAVIFEKCTMIKVES